MPPGATPEPCPLGPRWFAGSPAVRGSADWLVLRLCSDLQPRTYRKPEHGLVRIARNACPATHVPVGKDHARQGRVHPAHGRRRGQGLHLETGHGRGAAHGRAPEEPGPGAGHAHRVAGQEHGPLDDGRLGHLDGRPRVGAAVSHAGRQHGAPDPRAQRSQAALRRQARRVGRDETRRARRPADDRPAAGAQDRRPQLGKHRRQDRADDRQPRAPRRRAVHPDLHLWHHRPAQGRDAQLRHLRLVDHQRPEARQARFERPHAQLPAAGPRGRAHARRARPAGHRHARVLCRKPGDLRLRHSARAADGVLLGAPPVGQVPAGRAGQDARREDGKAAEDPDHQAASSRRRSSPGWAWTR